MGYIEMTATALGVVHLLFLIRQNIWAFPIGMAMVALYGVVFFDAQLYGTAGLQAVFFSLLGYGWWYWLVHREKAEADDKAPVIALSTRVLLLWLGAGVIGVGVIGTIMDRFTDGVLPYVDAIIVSFSLIAQLLLARKVLQNWLIWMGVNVVAIGLYFSQGLMFTTGLYVLFLVMCVWGVWEWRRDMAKPSNTAE